MTLRRRIGRALAFLPLNAIWALGYVLAACGMVAVVLTVLAMLCSEFVVGVGIFAVTLGAFYLEDE